MTGGPVRRQVLSAGPAPYLDVDHAAQHANRRRLADEGELSPMINTSWGDSYVGVLECDVLLGDVGSLKHKRAVIRPVLARLRRLDVAATEAGDTDRHRRALITVATVSGEADQVHRVLDTCERQMSGEVELELLSTRRRIIGPHDESPATKSAGAIGPS